MSRKSVLIAGGEGFVGAHFALLMLERGYQVVSVDNHTFGPALATQNPRFAAVRRVMASAEQPGLLESLAGEHQFIGIVNLAGPARQTYYRAHPAASAETILQVNMRLISLASMLGVPLVMASSSEIYGTMPHRPFKETEVGASNPLSSRAPYSEAKRMSETLAWSKASQGRFPLRILRLFNVYGGGYSEDDDRVIPQFLSALRAGQPLQIHGRGDQIRSFCHVSDIVAAIALALRLEAPQRCCINLGNPEPVSISGLAQIMASIAGAQTASSVNIAPDEDEVAYRCPDIAEAQRLLGWSPTITLAEGLRRLVEGTLDRRAKAQPAQLTGT